MTNLQLCGRRICNGSCYEKRSIFSHDKVCAHASACRSALNFTIISPVAKRKKDLSCRKEEFGIRINLIIHIQFKYLMMLYGTAFLDNNTG